MDNATNDLLRDIATLQKEQNELLKRYLWRLRFSLLTLLLITTATAVMLGIYVTRSKTVAPATSPYAPVPAFPFAPYQAAPVPTPMPLPSPPKPPQSTSRGVPIMPLRQ